MTSIKYSSFQEFRQESKLAQLIDGNYPIIDVKGITQITKINHTVNDMEKLLLIVGYVDETLFERQYERIV